VPQAVAPGASDLNAEIELSSKLGPKLPNTTSGKLTRQSISTEIQGQEMPT
jgi:hypothetical protein